MNTIAKQLLICSNLGLKWRVSLGAGLSIGWVTRNALWQQFQLIQNYQNYYLQRHDHWRLCHNFLPGKRWHIAGERSHGHYGFIDGHEEEKAGYYCSLSHFSRSLGFKGMDRLYVRTSKGLRRYSGAGSDGMKTEMLISHGQAQMIQ